MRYLILENGVDELGTLTICALRYCLGRTSYMPSLIVEATKANWILLTEKDKAIIKKDISEAITNKYLGMDCDKQMWKSFYQWILEKSTAEN